jgi:hypothetical protein
VPSELALTKRYLRADTYSESVGPDFNIRDEFDIDWVTYFNDEDWGYTPGGTRVRKKNVKRVSDSKGSLQEAA